MTKQQNQFSQTPFPSPGPTPSADGVDPILTPDERLAIYQHIVNKAKQEQKLEQIREEELLFMEDKKNDEGKNTRIQTRSKPPLNFR